MSCNLAWYYSIPITILSKSEKLLEHDSVFLDLEWNLRACLGSVLENCFLFSRIEKH